MKKATAIFLVILLMVSICGCGAKSDDHSSKQQQSSSTKGKKNDPYRLGEEIKFTSCNMGEENYFDVSLTINALTNEEQSNAEKVMTGGIYSTKECLGIEFILKSKDGKFSDTIQGGTTSGGFFLINAYTDNMTETYFRYFTHDSRNFIYDFYADTNYNLYMNYAEENEYTMLSIEYRTGEYDTSTIWVDLT